jgi:hypothetical protein
MAAILRVADIILDRDNHAENLEGIRGKSKYAGRKETQEVSKVKANCR